MLAVYILFTLLSFVAPIGLAISFYFFVFSKKDDYIASVIGIVFCTFIFGFDLPIAYIFHSHYYDNRMTRDIHQGDVFSLPILSSEKKKEIANNHFWSLDFSVGQLTDSLECHQRWSIGQSIQYEFDGSSFSMTVLGRATKPDYRYLLSLDSGFDFPCIKSVLVTPHQLAAIKTDWKKAWTIIRMPGKTDSSEMELRSVQPLEAAGPHNIVNHSAH